MNFSDLTLLDFTEFVTIMSLTCGFLILLYTSGESE